jgi:hypothetical protein
MDGRTLTGRIVWERREEAGGDCDRQNNYCNIIHFIRAQPCNVAELFIGMVSGQAMVG